MCDNSLGEREKKKTRVIGLENIHVAQKEKEMPKKKPVRELIREI